MNQRQKAQMTKDKQEERQSSHRSIDDIDIRHFVASQIARFR